MNLSAYYQSCALRIEQTDRKHPSLFSYPLCVDRIRNVCKKIWMRMVANRRLQNQHHWKIHNLALHFSKKTIHTLGFDFYLEKSIYGSWRWKIDERFVFKRVDSAIILRWISSWCYCNKILDVWKTFQNGYFHNIKQSWWNIPQKWGID